MNISEDLGRKTVVSPVVSTFVFRCIIVAISRLTVLIGKEDPKEPHSNFLIAERMSNKDPKSESRLSNNVFKGENLE